MRRTWVLVVSCGLLVAAAACNGTASRPAAVPVDGDGTTPPPRPKDKVTKPARTDPAAEAVIDKLLDAHTGGKHERLAQLKSHKSVRKGKFEGPGAAVWTVQAVWPDKFRQQSELTQLGVGQNITTRNGAGGWKLLPSQGMTEPVPLSAAEFTAFQTDIYGEWTALLVPLLDPKARVAAPVASGDVEGRPASGVRVWVGDYPPVVLRVDAVGHLARIEYEIADGTGTVPIQITFLDRKEVNGVLLPVKSAYVVNNRPISTWDSAEYEFPAAFPPTVFEQP